MLFIRAKGSRCPTCPKGLARGPCHAAEESVEELRKGTLGPTAEHVPEVPVLDADAGPRGLTAEPLLPELRGVASAPLPLTPLGPELIEFGSLLRVGENLIGLVDLLEALLGLGVAGVDVRVVAACQPAVGTLDLAGIGIALDP